MRTVEIKKTKKEQPKQEKEKVEFPEGAESFSQTTKDEEIICFCCGKPGEYANECPMQKQIAENNWFKNTGVKHYLKDKPKQVNAQVAAGATRLDAPKENTKGTTQTYVLRLHPIVIEFFVDDAMLIVNL